METWISRQPLMNTVILSTKILFTASFERVSTLCKRNHIILLVGAYFHAMTYTFCASLNRESALYFFNANNYVTTLTTLTTFNLCALFGFSSCRASVVCIPAPTLRNAHRWVGMRNFTGINLSSHTIWQPTSCLLFSIKVILLAKAYLPMFVCVFIWAVCITSRVTTAYTSLVLISSSYSFFFNICLVYINFKVSSVKISTCLWGNIDQCAWAGTRARSVS